MENQSRRRSGRRSRRSTGPRTWENASADAGPSLSGRSSDDDPSAADPNPASPSCAGPRVGSPRAARPSAASPSAAVPNPAGPSGAQEAAPSDEIIVLDTDDDDVPCGRGFKARRSVEEDELAAYIALAQSFEEASNTQRPPRFDSVAEAGGRVQKRLRSSSGAQLPEEIFGNDGITGNAAAPKRSYQRGELPVGTVQFSSRHAKNSHPDTIPTPPGMYSLEELDRALGLGDHAQEDDAGNPGSSDRQKSSQDPLLFPVPPGNGKSTADDPVSGPDKILRRKDPRASDERRRTRQSSRRSSRRASVVTPGASNHDSSAVATRSARPKGFSRVDAEPPVRRAALGRASRKMDGIGTTAPTPGGAIVRTRRGADSPLRKRLHGSENNPRGRMSESPEQEKLSTDKPRHKVSGRGSDEKVPSSSSDPDVGNVPGVPNTTPPVSMSPGKGKFHSNRQHLPVNSDPGSVENALVGEQTSQTPIIDENESATDDEAPHHVRLLRRRRHESTARRLREYKELRLSLAVNTLKISLVKGFSRERLFAKSGASKRSGPVANISARDRLKVVPVPFDMSRVVRMAKRLEERDMIELPELARLPPTDLDEVAWDKISEFRSLPCPPLKPALFRIDRLMAIRRVRQLDVAREIASSKAVTNRKKAPASVSSHEKTNLASIAIWASDKKQPQVTSPTVNLKDANPVDKATLPANWADICR